MQMSIKDVWCYYNKQPLPKIFLSDYILLNYRESRPYSKRKVASENILKANCQNIYNFPVHILWFIDSLWHSIKGILCILQIMYIVCIDKAKYEWQLMKCQSRSPVVLWSIIYQLHIPTPLLVYTPKGFTMR